MIESSLLPLVWGPWLVASAPEQPVQPTTEPAAATGPEASEPRLARGYLKLVGLDRPRFITALSPRLPHLAFEPFAAAAQDPSAMAEGLAAFVEIAQVDPDAAEPDEPLTFALTIVISDGRAFDRQLAVDPQHEDPVRVLASATANLITAIEAGTVEADRGDAPLPVAAACPVCECPQPPACPTAPPPAEPSPKPPAPLPAPLPRFELGPVVMPALSLGLGLPRTADRFAAAGSTIGLHARLRHGAFLGAEARMSGRAQGEDNQLLRLRVGLGAGYRLRREHFALGTSLWATVEPWWLRGEAIDPSPLPLFGLALRTSPAIVFDEVGGRPIRIAFGPVLELAASANLGNGASAVLVTSVTPDENDRLPNAVRAGGLEFNAGLALTLWLQP